MPKEIKPNRWAKNSLPDKNPLSPMSGPFKFIESSKNFFPMIKRMTISYSLEPYATVRSHNRQCHQRSSTQLGSLSYP